MNVSVPVNSVPYTYNVSNGCSSVIACEILKTHPYMMIAIIFTRSDTSEQTCGYALKVSPKPNRTLYTRLYRFQCVHKDLD